MQNRITYSLLTLGLIIGGLGSVRAQPADPLTQREITRLLSEALPHVNAALTADGAPNRPIASPRLQFVTPAEFHRLPDPETDAIIRTRLGVLSGKVREHALDSAHAACAAVALARYRPGTDVIAVSVPVDERRVVSWSSTALPDTPEIGANRALQLTIVHEMVRMHLDKIYGWSDRIAKCRDEDELRTILSLVEGRARQVTDLVADKLGSYIYAGVLAQRYRALPEDGADPEKLAVVRAMVFRMRQDACTEGKAFFESLARAQVKPLEATAFTSPPRQYLWITRPELYVKAWRDGVPDLGQVLKKLEAMPPGATAKGAGWTVTQQAMAPDMFREVANLLKEQARAEAVLRAYEEGRSVVWTNPRAPGPIVMNVTRFATPAAARAYHGFTLDLQRKRDEQLSTNCTGTCRVLESRSEAVAMPRADAAVRCFKKVQSGGGPPVSADMLYILAGAYVIELDGFSAPLDPAWSQHAVGEFLTELWHSDRPSHMTPERVHGGIQ